MVAHVNEHALAHFAVRGDAAGDGDFRAVVVFAAFIFFASGFARFRRRKFVFERINAFGAQGGELGLALLNQRIRVVHQSLRIKPQTPFPRTEF
ncbi:MAG: hypothetical protein ABSF51_09985 [Verrucomicrobiota bacterium]